jgi:hypothetical protein
MTEHNLFYYPHASFTNAQLRLLKVVALYFDKLVILDPVGASWASIGADYHGAGRLLNDTAGNYPRLHRLANTQGSETLTWTGSNI